ncbi:hypothetical protein CAP31_09175 [Sulfuriferula sp. AH1]|uniref:hypothetical protein n=1 Tax=Sulfuriferula sp. AH1 TaxID=1985873 RepID=UPI000B3B3973|nr:hypothetical protein [Sulfuriferula sp. AH1]ARU31830.1 hypothetical protein CAP31_09175 [Sulfuriferula sp. AH1]
MGNKKNEDKWLPATPLRIKAFACSLLPDVDDHLGQGVKTRGIQQILSMLKNPINNISETTIRSWLAGEKQPSKLYVNWIKQGLPECADWLEPDLDSSSLRRFICALDIWGSRIDSPRRKLDTASSVITVGKGLAVLAKRWGPTPIKYSLYDAIIPSLKRLVPHQISPTLYQSFNPFSLMEFMFRCGPYLELTSDEFTEWAIDLASLTLITEAFIEGTSMDERRYSGAGGDYSRLTYRIFFLGHGNWPNLESVKEELELFAPVFEDSAIDYPQYLMRARKVIEHELLSIGSDLSIVKELSYRIKDRNRMWSEP